MNDDPDLRRWVIKRMISFRPPDSEDVAKAQEWLLTGTGTVPSARALAMTVNGYERHPGIAGPSVKRLVDEFEASGSDRAEFCRDRCLALSTLQRHLRTRKLGSRARGGGSRLVAVRVTPMTEAIAKPPEPSLEVVLADGRRIGVRPGFHAGTLQELITALEQG